MGVNLADKVIGEVALAELINEVRKLPRFDGDWSPAEWSEELLKRASKVKFQPSTRQLVLTFDLAFGSNDQVVSGPVE
jgi:hypothetical protein